MGTDILLYAETRVGQAWQPVPEPWADPASGRLEPVEAFEVFRPYELFQLLSGKPVWMFQDLAEAPPVFTARGFPDDMNPIYRETLPAWYERDISPGGGGNWGASWLGLRELVELDWDQKFRRHAYVQERYAKYFRPDEAFPAAFPKEGKLDGGAISCRPAPGMCRVAWSESLREYVGCSEWFIEQLSALAPGEELRIIYWFNS
jgi:hypothetical protein